MSDWIQCESQMPDEAISILFCSKGDRYPLAGYFMPTHNIFMEYRFNRIHPRKNVDYWMPFPSCQ